MTYQECKTPDCGNPVFAGGLCRKHYDKERLATAPPCSVSGCAAQSFRAGLCEPHYRADLMRLRPVCTVPNCGSPQRNLSMGLCQKHEYRARKHGTTAQARPADWGSREAHPLYSTWAYHRRQKNGLCAEWQNDFWGFVAIVKDRPAGFSLRRKDTTAPLGPDNWFWKPAVSSKDKAAYARVWRAHNPERAKHHNLKRHYGITLEQYNMMGEAQGWVCAICKNPESTKDKDGGPRQMPVDHDHNTGKVRALLCTQCNRGLGMFTDNIDKLKAAAAYLEAHKVDPTPAS